ncbi:MAG: FAD-binding protein [Myxococcota bacterium]|nr:FAD-binding protein [Myxococcota bacterium]MDW8362459.1 D-arabinono-1,4-lactone oxidase [Myxococcales bacterium]
MRRERFRNWAGTVEAAPRQWLRPIDERELSEQIARAAAAGQRVKAVGSGHSWNDIAAGDDVLVSVDRLARLEQVDRERGTILVGAGLKLRHLNDQIAALDLALPIVGSIAEQTLAGVVSTATHGSSLRHGNLSSLVVGVRLVDGEGRLHRIDERDPRLPAVRVGLGALGILTAIELRVERGFRLTETVEAMRFDHACARLVEIARSAEYVKLWWLPSSRRLLVYRHERTNRPANVGRRARWIEQRLMHDVLFEALLRLGGRFPPLVAPVGRLVTEAFARVRPRTDRADRALRVPMPPVHRETEYSVALERGAELLEGTRRLIERLRLRVDFPVEVRFGPADDAWLSPSYGRDSCHVGAYMARAPGAQAYFDGFEELARSLEGRPHWGKEHRAEPTVLRKIYPRFDDWVAVRRQLDPHGRFRNAWLDRTVGT